MKLDVNFKNGAMYGSYKEYFSNGVLYIECNYGENGKLDGVYKEYDAEGKLVKECYYSNGSEQFK